MKRMMIRHKFVDFIPDIVEDGILYISIPYATATHKCACRCGEIVVTPIRSTYWMLIWNGEVVTIKPSIGNWSLPCQSHYFIEENRIIWVKKWNDSEINMSRAKDMITKTQFYRKLGVLFHRICGVF